jgi:hypothetical protein
MRNDAQLPRIKDLGFRIWGAEIHQACYSHKLDFRHLPSMPAGASPSFPRCRV